MLLMWLSCVAAALATVQAYTTQPAMHMENQPSAPDGTAVHAKKSIPEKCPAIGLTNLIQGDAIAFPSHKDVVNFMQAETKSYPIIGSPQTWKANFDKIYPPAAEQKNFNTTSPLAVGKVRDLYTKCQYAGNLSYCELVDYKVPFYGWYEWAQYQEQCLEHYVEYYYKDKDTSPECIEAMKNMGCASYFPRCEGQDAEGRDLYLKPCKSLCEIWKYDLKCPGSEAIDCRNENAQSINFARYGSCTDYGFVPQPPAPTPKPNATKAAPFHTAAQVTLNQDARPKQVETAPAVPALVLPQAQQASAAAASMAPWSVPAMFKNVKNSPVAGVANNAANAAPSVTKTNLMAAPRSYKTEEEEVVVAADSLRKEGGELASAPSAMSASELRSTD